MSWGENWGSKGDEHWYEKWTNDGISGTKIIEKKP